MDVFWLGVHQPNWLEQSAVPMMVSYRRLANRSSFPRARGPVAEDSGGFTYLSQNGHWPIAPERYAADVRRHVVEVGNIDWVAIQDWMCEPFILGKTGLSIIEHQERTVESFLDLRELAPEVPWLPIVQGWDPDDYERHVEMYDRRGVDLRGFDLVGVGSVCSRQGAAESARIFEGLHRLGLKLHGFGLKVTGLVRARAWLRSADSMAWSLDGRMPKGGRCSVRRSHRSCANCLTYAQRWRSQLLQRLAQGALFA